MQKWTTHVANKNRSFLSTRALTFYFQHKRVWSALISTCLFLGLLAPYSTAHANTPAPGIHLEITTYLGDRQTFVAGDRLSFLVTLDHTAHLLVVYETAKQQLIQLLPHRYSNGDTYQPGYYIAVPDEQAHYEFVIAPPFGKEKILAFACDKPFTTLPGTALANGLRVLSDNKQQLTQHLHQMCDNKQGMFGKASLELTTRAH